MISLDTFLLFVVACVPVVLAPGPSVALIVTTALTSGPRAGALVVAGVEVGYLVHVVAAALGLSALLAASAEAFTIVRVLGAAYLVWLGIQAWKSKDTTPLGELAKKRDSAPSDQRSFRNGLVVGVLNPKTAIFFLAFLPVFVDPANGSTVTQFVLLGLTFVLLATVPDMTWALGASGLRRLMPHVKLRTMERVSGTVMFGLAGYALATVIGPTSVTSQ